MSPGKPHDEAFSPRKERSMPPASGSPSPPPLVAEVKPADCKPEMPLIHMSRGVKSRKIRGHDLSIYLRPEIPGNRNAAWRAAWYLVNAWLFQGAVLALIPSPWKAAILRAFGARVGKGFVCKPRVTIKYPWFLEIGDHVWLGECVWIDNHTSVRIGNNVCISQNAYLFTGNHDWNDPAFRFFCAPIDIADGCWVGTGVRVGPGTMLAAGSVMMIDAR
jgi:putative colanic acid biosynthesis acetyltransferase WcaF